MPMQKLDPMLPASELRDLANEVRQLFDDLDRAFHGRGKAPSWEYAPLIDVLETEESIEILVDLPGVDISNIRVLVKGGVVIVAGAKLPPDDEARVGASFHLVERGFGRFARAIRVTGAIDGGRIQARLRSGELRISLPKIVERRGRDILVPVQEETIG
jgi:HSP20 family protein